MFKILLFSAVILASIISTLATSLISATFALIAFVLLLTYALIQKAKQ